MPSFQIHIVNQISDVDQNEWNALLPDSNPFLRYEFLAGLETCGCITADTGWQANHFLIKNNQNQLVGAMPAYLKQNSFGEFVFDWSWASAYENVGLRYYPKLVSAIPFTPVTGPRLLTGQHANRETINQFLIDAIKDDVDKNSFSSFHCLFPEQDHLDQLVEHQLLARVAYQYHWHNQHYQDFDHYLSFFRSQKRKNVKRERRRVNESGIQIRVLHGDELNDEQWNTVYHYYRSTFLKKGNYPALTLEFFKHLAVSMPANLVIVLAEYKNQSIAAAINFRSDDRLYGRYWGSEIQFQNLHFEVCFYAGIEYCINNGLNAFEPGAQGEHKITRGFLPTETYSMHWIADPRFRTAIKDFLRREQQAIKQYKPQLDKLSPFRASDSE
ncbi:MAG: N-acetyltransferase [Gammaproteobacteria bacterium]|nr:N-acetyltransferase [Gammaproteobacteria bacterium]